MKLDRQFTTHQPEAEVRERIAAYLLGKQYRQVALEPLLVFERGSKLGSWTSFRVKGWKVTTTVQLTPDEEGTTRVVATFDIDTTGQVVAKHERTFWNQEVEGLIASVEGFAAAPTLTFQIEQKLQLEKRAAQGPGWFFWIAGLSLLNSVLGLLGGSLNFLMGLGITQFIAGIAVGLGQVTTPQQANLAKGVGFALSVVAAGIFAGFGLLGRKHRWVYILGMVLYALDSILFLAFGPDFLSFGFHILALVGLFTGLRAMSQRQAQA